MAVFRVRFIAEADAVSWAIRVATFSEFSHVEIVSEDQRAYIGARALTGIHERPADYCKPSFERRYAIPVTDEQLRRGMAYASSKIGTRYNYADIAGLFLHRNITTKGRAICSQFVFNAFEAMGVYPLNVLAAYDFRVTPDTLHLSPMFIGKCYFQTKACK